jgi:hypothetical protein
MNGAAFSPESLDANRSGLLSDWQRSTLKNVLSTRHSGLAGLVGRAVDPMARDVQDGWVQVIEGALAKPPPEQAPYGNMPSRHFLRVSNRTAGIQQFRCARDIYDFAPDAGMVRLYYLPRAAHCVNLELLPAAPAGEQR